MTRERLIPLAAVATLSGLLSGCGITDPYQDPSASTARSSTTTAMVALTTSSAPAADAQDPRPERGGTIPAVDQRAQDHVNAGAGARTARAAVRRYARLYINWTAGTLASDQRHLVALSIAAARLAAEQQARSAATDRTLRTHHLANHGQVISAQPGTGAERGRWVIVTREQTTGTGNDHDLPYELHITFATTTHTRQGWVIAQWSPQT